MNVKKVYTTPYRPQTDGLTERFNKTLAQMLTMYSNRRQSNWDDILNWVLLAYRTSRQVSTRETPFFMTYGRDAFLPLNRIYQSQLDEPYTPDEWTEKLLLDLKEAFAVAEINAKTARAAQERNYNAGREPIIFNIDSLVWYYHPKKIKGQVQKLSNLWTGPFKVVKQLSANVYTLEDLITASKFNANIARMKPCTITLSEALELRKMEPEVVIQAGEEIETDISTKLEIDDQTNKKIQRIKSLRGAERTDILKEEVLTEEEENTLIASDVAEEENRATISPEDEVFPVVAEKAEPYFDALLRCYMSFRDLDQYKPRKMGQQLKVYFDKPFIRSSTLKNALHKEITTAQKSRATMLQYLLQCLVNFNTKFEVALAEIPDVPSIKGGRV